MIWYLIMCFSLDGDWVCKKTQAPSYEACLSARELFRAYAVNRQFEAEVDCITLEEYT